MQCVSHELSFCGDKTGVLSLGGLMEAGGGERYGVCCWCFFLLNLDNLKGIRDGCR